VAFVENGGFGAEAAAPIARKVMDAYFDASLLEAALKRNVDRSEQVAAAAQAAEVRRAR